MPTYRATFHPQAWVNDYAIEVDPQGPTTWEVTPELIASLPAGWNKSCTYESDELRNDPAAPEWVREWTGPFDIEVERVN